jgi:exosome complex component RRP41
MGNTKVICTVTGPQEFRRTGADTGAGGAGDEARIEVDISIAGFSGVDRRRKAGRNDRYVGNDA